MVTAGSILENRRKDVNNALDEFYVVEPSNHRPLVDSPYPLVVYFVTLNCLTLF